ncbi:condensation domain-containing protein, partial [Bacillus pumilus]|uniref:condensation domain-containing protein n=1 Tax=Bacillus pumilus TaxID=1408 RepID=UPI0034D96B6B
MPLLHLPTHFPPPPNQNFHPNLYSYHFHPTFPHNFLQFSSNQPLTFFITLLPPYNPFLYKYSPQHHILIPSPILPPSNPELQNLIPIFTNTILFTNYPTPPFTFPQFLQTLKHRSLSVYENAHYLFREL